MRPCNFVNGLANHILSPERLLQSLPSFRVPCFQARSPMSVIGIIPARLQSTRLPNKLLLTETGKPLIQHTYEAVQGATRLDEIIVATDSEEIAETCRNFGARIAMTGHCVNGTERVARAVHEIDRDCELVVNIQGDEPEIDPAAIDLCIRSLQEHQDCVMSTLANPITSADQVLDPACVKVVCDSQGRALYFSRAPIPHSRDAAPADLLNGKPAEQPSPWLQHIGLYAYRSDFLLEFVELPVSPLEQLEQLEQLRVLQAGRSIHVSVVEHAATGIDTPADYAAFVRRYQTGQ